MNDDIKPTADQKVKIDGHIWSVNLPGAGTELKITKSERRQKILTKKSNDGTLSESECDEMDKIEDFFYEVFCNFFKDGTDDNHEVRNWVEKTPMSHIIRAIEDIKTQAND